MTISLSSRYLAKAIYKGGYMISQEQMILNHLQTIGPISQKKAAAEYGIYRLSGRIFELRQHGHDIESVWREELNRYGVKTRFVEYQLKGQENGKQKNVQYEDSRQ